MRHFLAFYRNVETLCRVTTIFTVMYLPLSWCIVTFTDLCTHCMEGSRYSSLLVVSVHYFQTDPVPINVLRAVAQVLVRDPLRHINLGSPSDSVIRRPPIIVGAITPRYNNKNPGLKKRVQSERKQQQIWARLTASLRLHHGLHVETCRC